MTSGMPTADMLHTIESLERERTQALSRFIDLDWTCRTVAELVLPKNCPLTCRDSLTYASGPPRTALLTISEVIPSINREIRIRQFPEDAKLWQTMRGWWHSRMNSLVRQYNGKLPFAPLDPAVVVVGTDPNRYRDLDNYNLKLALDALASTRIIRNDGSILAYAVVRQGELTRLNCVRFLIIEAPELINEIVEPITRTMERLELTSVPSDTVAQPLYCEKCLK